MSTGLKLSGGLFYVGSFVVALTAYQWSKRRRSRLPLPPGPKKLPLVGNLFDLPPKYEWETYARWSEEYGSDILHIDAAGTSIIIVNSHQVAFDLFEKRSSIYSSRVTTPMLFDLIKWDWLFGFMPYGEAWKERRRLFQSKFHPSDTASFQPQQLDCTHKLLKNLLQNPEDFSGNFRLVMGAITLSIAYGLEITSTSDPFLEIAEQALIGLGAGSTPGAFLVDSLPFLKHVPAWFPGASFKRRAAVWREWTRKLRDAPFEAAEQAIKEGNAPPSFVSTCLGDLDEKRDKENQRTVVRDTAGNFFVGGSDTGVAALNTFIMMMVSNPEVQAKAQAELDTILGKNVLPTFEDEASLPYITAIVKETLRIHAITPCAVPHALMEDDEYKGYFLPKGSVVLGNAWAILHDEKEYPDAFAFKPERWLKPDGSLNPSVRDPTVAFGFGRRICPGKHMAYALLYITMSSILSMFELSHAKDQHDHIIEIKKEFTSSLVSHPLPFKCSIQPRSEEARRVILAL